MLIKFLLVGSVSTALNYLVFAICLGLNIYYLAASLIGYLSGLSVGYLFNRNWTFSSHKATHKQHQEIGTYLLVNLTSLVLSLLLLRSLVDGLLWPAWFSNILAIGLSTTTNYLGLKFVVFKAHLHHDSI